MTMTETAPRVDETATVLAAMLTENTGRHVLDSGGAYGRNHERNAAMDVDAFKARPAVDASTWERDGKTVVSFLSLDVFHFLTERLSYNAERDAAFHAFATSEDMADESWPESLDAWHKAAGLRYVFGENTYNHEDALSQVVNYSVLEDEDTGDKFAAVQIHGGCDVRGGYTAPRIFDIGCEYGLADNADFSVVLTEPEATPAALAQGALLDAYPVPTGGRYLALDYRGNTFEDAYSSDESLTDGIVSYPRPSGLPFEFEETAVVVADDGTTTIADGPFAGWELSFDPPVCST